MQAGFVQPSWPPQTVAGYPNAAFMQPWQPHPASYPAQTNFYGAVAATQAYPEDAYGGGEDMLSETCDWNRQAGALQPMAATQAASPLTTAWSTGTAATQHYVEDGTGLVTDVVHEPEPLATLAYGNDGPGTETTHELQPLATLTYADEEMPPPPVVVPAMHRQESIREHHLAAQDVPMTQYYTDDNEEEGEAVEKDAKTVPMTQLYPDPEISVPNEDAKIEKETDTFCQDKDNELPDEEEVMEKDGMSRCDSIPMTQFYQAEETSVPAASTHIVPNHVQAEEDFASAVAETQAYIVDGPQESVLEEEGFEQTSAVAATQAYCVEEPQKEGMEESAETSPPTDVEMDDAAHNEELCEKPEELPTSMEKAQVALSEVATPGLQSLRVEHVADIPVCGAPTEEDTQMKIDAHHQVEEVCEKCPPFDECAPPHAHDCQLEPEQLPQAAEGVSPIAEGQEYAATEADEAELATEVAEEVAAEKPVDEIAEMATNVEQVDAVALLEPDVAGVNGMTTEKEFQKEEMAANVEQTCTIAALEPPPAIESNVTREEVPNEQLVDEDLEGSAVAVDTAAALEPTPVGSDKMLVEESMSKLDAAAAASPAPARRQIPTPARSPYPASVSYNAAELVSSELADGASPPPTKRRRLFYKQSPPAEYVDITKATPKRPARNGKTAAKKAKVAKADKVIMTTAGFDLEPEQRHFLKKTLKVKLVDYFSSNVSHVLADSFTTSTKLMCAICSGAKILSSKYLEACMEARRLVDDSEYLLNDTAGEEAFAEKFGLEEYSLQTAAQQRRKAGPLLSGMSVHCALGVSGRQDLKTLVAAMGGKWLATAPRREPDERLLLLVDPQGLSDRDQDRLRAGLLFSPELLKEAACTQVCRRDVYRLAACSSEQDAPPSQVADSAEDSKMGVLLPAL